jgi:hypothetical protein
LTDFCPIWLAIAQLHSTAGSASVIITTGSLFNISENIQACDDKLSLESTVYTIFIYTKPIFLGPFIKKQITFFPS